MTTNKRHYYAGISAYGIRTTFSSKCWVARRFDSKKERDQFLEENYDYYKTEQNQCAITRKEAEEIVGRETTTQKWVENYEGNLELEYKRI